MTVPTIRAAALSAGASLAAGFGSPGAGGREALTGGVNCPA
ncbi:hypothetical protein SCE1572_44275 [Sorangium cellulosum So0157-2]|uniref:Uncharacterized protein n=1 Tax=Sorangium cellulosum So0157-2 TaxID=1254432 RepID=S4Y9G2_SORCE|nr:hypothetical protein SCE1572_44275 [Sorangium cellulosum So0157-2]